MRDIEDDQNFLEENLKSVSAIGTLAKFALSSTTKDIETSHRCQTPPKGGSVGTAAALDWQTLGCRRRRGEQNEVELTLATAQERPSHHDLQPSETTQSSTHHPTYSSQQIIADRHHSHLCWMTPMPSPPLLDLMVAV
eukprot:CAMPEP_0180791696 /NCGR_PEP_ID=MMETSP1038_2-20121128/53967_1 /TAXON_ID=632150 /ORGANISM="Azadinium spinosum, Strain 3D9" /LENGTH=137 /DNA_ID=CAMNT_0022829893 /DNA_START=39 /DNA_END=451 /DNA_ORIENTATION=-